MEPVREPTDAEFSALLDARAPGRLKEDEAPENAPAPSMREELERNRAAQLAVPAPLEPETPQAPQAPAPDLETVPDKLAGKSAEEIAAMYANLETLTGRHSQELGELRARNAQLAEMLAAGSQIQPQAQPVTQETVDWVEEQMMTNPQAAIAWVEQNQPLLYDRAVTTWAQLDPFAASSYNTDRKIRAMEEKHQQEIATLQRPVAASQNERELQTAWTAVANEVPGFDQVSNDLGAVIEEQPEWKTVLASPGNTADKHRVLTNAALLALAKRAVQGEPVAPATAPPAVPSATETVDPAVAAAAEKLRAIVATGSAVGEHGGQAPRDDFKSRMLATERTSIADELARNRAAHGR